MADPARAAAGVAKYDPQTDLVERYPFWRVRFLELFELCEVICWEERLILLSDRCDPRSCLAHAIAHLDLGHGRDRRIFTDRERQEAQDLAAARLGA